MAVGTATRSTNTLDEFVRKMLHLISDAKASPDIDDVTGLPFLIDLETTILEFIRQPMEATGQPTGAEAPPGAAPGFAPDMAPTGPAGPMGLPPEAMGMGPPPGPGGPGVAGLRNTPQVPPGELARLIR
jgi:hypothetical protein